MFHPPLSPPLRVADPSREPGAHQWLCLVLLRRANTARPPHAWLASYARLPSETDYDLDYDLRRLWSEAQETLARMPDETQSSGESKVGTVATAALARARQHRPSPSNRRPANVPLSMQRQWIHASPDPMLYHGSPNGSPDGSPDDVGEREIVDEEDVTEEEGMLLSSSSFDATGRPGGISRLNEYLTTDQHSASPTEKTTFVI